MSTNTSATLEELLAKVSDMSVALQEVRDKQEISDLIQAYCMAVDRMDLPALKAMYHPDGFDDHGDFGSGPVDNFFASVEASQKSKSRGIVQHHITSIVIKVDGTYAEAQSWVIAFHVIATETEGPFDFVYLGRYADKLEKRDGIWKFFHRRPLMDMSYRVQKSAMRLDDPISSGMYQGHNGPDDPSYPFFKLFSRGQI